MTTWEDVAARIAQLDGVTRTELSIARHEAADSWAEPRETGLLSVSGGGEGRVLVLYSILDDGLVTSCVVENERGDALETRIAGAEPLSLPARCWVAKDLAVTAALTYAEGGGRDPALCWEPYRPPGDA